MKHTTEKILFISVVIILFMHIEISGQGATPTTELSASEVADPQQKGANNKIGRNLAAWYGSARKMASASLQVVQNVSNMAWAAHKQLVAIERVAQKTQLIYDNISDFKLENPVQVVEDLHLKVFQKTDELFYKDIPEMVGSREALRADRKVFLSSVGALMKQSAEFTRIAYGTLLSVIMPVDEMIESDNRTAERSLMISHTAAQGVAKAQGMELITDHQEKMLGISMEDAQKDTLDPIHLSEQNLENTRNNLLLKVQEHAVVGNTVSNLSWMIIDEIAKMDRALQQRTLLLRGLEEFSEALKEHKVD